MSESAPRELKILVERIVRPLPLPLERQRRLRQDYLEHLQAMYAEETAQGQDPVQAMERVRQRFGDTTEISAELRREVRWWEAAQARLQLIFLPKGNESVLGFTVRMSLDFFSVLAILLVLVSLDHHVFGVESFSIEKLKIAVLSLSLVTCWLACILFFGQQAGQAWESQPRSWSRLLQSSIAHFLSWPLIVMGMAGGTMADDAWPIALSIAGGIVSVVCGVIVGVRCQRELQYRREWSQLDLDGEALAD